MYSIFAGAWEPSYAPEFWVGVQRPVNSSAVLFADGGSVPALDGVPVEAAVQLLDPGCLADVRGCCASLTDRMVGTFRGFFQTPRTPQLVLRNCLTM